MTKRFARRFGLATLVLVAGSIFPLTARAQDQVVSSPVFQAAAQVQAYWTAERMLRAKPMPLPILSGGPNPSVAGGAAAPAGPMVLAGSGAPGSARGNDLAGAQAEAALVQASGPSPQFAAGTFAYTRFRLFKNTNAQYKTFPYSAAGQLFFTIPGQGDFICSGSSINSTNNSVIWTAGHCVNTPGTGFHTNFLFQPGRREGSAPFGSWTVKQAFTTNQWANTGQFEFDHGALVARLGGTSNNKLGVAVGFLGFLANASRLQQWSLHGWPAAPRILNQTPPGAQFDGLHHEICHSAFGATDDPSVNGGALANGVGCDKTGGTSGGPWIVDFSGVGGATNFVNGNNSYRYTGPNPPENLKLFSPHFEAAAVNLRNAAQAVPVP